MFPQNSFPSTNFFLPRFVRLNKIINGTFPQKGSRRKIIIEKWFSRNKSLRTSTLGPTLSDLESFFVSKEKEGGNKVTPSLFRSVYFLTKTQLGDCFLSYPLQTTENTYVENPCLTWIIRIEV